MDLIDPNPDIHHLFTQFDHQYFEGKLAAVSVEWSKRMKRCAGLCYYRARGGQCIVRLSEPLLKFRPRLDLINTLLHEMIHAYLFVTGGNTDHDGHGEAFKAHMRRINAAASTTITVFHSFHDEVDYYRVHVWQCFGPCAERPPYYGRVKRTMNRRPQPVDSWWSEHQRTCGGAFVKIAGPEFGRDGGTLGAAEGSGPTGASTAGGASRPAARPGGNSRPTPGVTFQRSKGRGVTLGDSPLGMPPRHLRNGTHPI